MIEKADHVIDIGPAAGKHGGEIVSEGSPKTIFKTPYLNGRLFERDERDRHSEATKKR